MTDHVVPVLRAAWIVLPAVVAAGLSDAIADRSATVGVAVEPLLWAGWAIGVVAVLVPRTVSLTVIRTLAPAAVLATAWGATADDLGVADLAALAAAALVATVAMAPQVGAHFIDGSSYGPERRLPLAPPVALLFGPVQVAVLTVLGGLAAGPVLLAARQWVPGGIALVVGPAVAFFAARALHGLSRRWVVLVPGGIVVHDALTLTDPVLLPKEALVAIEPAVVGTEATDLTQRARGLAVEIRLAEPGQFTLARRGRAEGEAIRTDAVLVTPTLPAPLLAAAHPQT